MNRFTLHLSLLLILFLVQGSFAKEINEATAMKVAKKFYSTKTINAPSIDVQNLTISLVYKFAIEPSSNNPDNDQKNLYYVFNINQSDGFVIISGDDIVVPVLGYSNRGTYDGNNLPPAFIKWMENYKKQIQFAKENKMEATDKIETYWEELLNTKNSSPSSNISSVNSVNPLLSTTWDQEPYYNDLCPGGAVTGCVATAMAQIMKYWNYPTHGQGFHSYSDQNYGVQSLDFSSTTYNWASMPDNVTSSNIEVSTLMYHCGVSVDMEYGVDVSNAYVISSKSPIINCAEYAYKTYFGYDESSIQGLERKSYTTSTWKNLLKNELDNSRPIQYAGFGNGGGHTFVCDGYDFNDFFHMNWGWGGNSDGFFEIDALNPGGTGTGGGTGRFNGNQQAVVGIKPKTGTGASTVDMYSSISITPNPIQFGLPFDVNADVINNGSSDFSGDFCAALFTSTGTFIAYIDTLSTSGNPLPPGSHYTGGLTFSNSGLLTVPGNYIIGIYYRDLGGNWNLSGDASFTNPLNFTINSPVDYVQQYSTIVATPSTFVQGEPASVNVNLINDNSATYYGQFQAALFDLNGNFVEEIGTYSETTGLPPGSSYISPYITFSTPVITAAPGTYILAIRELENGFPNWYLVGGDYYPTPININVVAPYLSPDIYESNNTQGTAYTLPLTWVNNNSHPLTTGSNNHIGTDYDFYNINLPTGYNYTITARVHDSYDSGNGNTYTNDVLWSYDSGSGWSLAYDDVMSGNILINGAATVSFQVAPFFAGQTGTYLLDIAISRTSTVGISDINSIDNKLSIFPNPASNFLKVKFEKNNQIDLLSIKNILGQTIFKFKPTQISENIDLSNFSNGLYFLEAIENNRTYSFKFIINR